MAVGAIGGALVTVMFGINVYGALAMDILFFSLTGAASAFVFSLIWSLGRDEPKGN